MGSLKRRKSVAAVVAGDDLNSPSDDKISYTFHHKGNIFLQINVLIVASIILTYILATMYSTDNKNYQQPAEKIGRKFERSLDRPKSVKHPHRIHDNVHTTHNSKGINFIWINETDYSDVACIKTDDDKQYEIQLKSHNINNLIDHILEGDNLLIDRGFISCEHHHNIILSNMPIAYKTPGLYRVRKRKRANSILFIEAEFLYYTEHFDMGISHSSRQSMKGKNLKPGSKPKRGVSLDVHPVIPMDFAVPIESTAKLSDTSITFNSDGEVSFDRDGKTIIVGLKDMSQIDLDFHIFVDFKITCGIPPFLICGYTLTVAEGGGYTIKLDPFIDIGIVKSWSGDALHLYFDQLEFIFPGLLEFGIAPIFIPFSRMTVGLSLTAKASMSIPMTWSQTGWKHTTVIQDGKIISDVDSGVQTEQKGAILLGGELNPSISLEFFSGISVCLTFLSFVVWESEFGVGVKGSVGVKGKIDSSCLISFNANLIAAVSIKSFKPGLPHPITQIIKAVENKRPSGIDKIFSAIATSLSAFALDIRNIDTIYPFEYDFATLVSYETCWLSALLPYSQPTTTTSVITSISTATTTVISAPTQGLKSSLDVIGTVPLSSIQNINSRIIAYVNSWSQYQSSKIFGSIPTWCDPYSTTPTNMNPDLITHLVYLALRVDVNGNILPYEWNDLTLLAQAVSLKSRNPKLKVLVSVGGWTFSTGTSPTYGPETASIFPTIAASPSLRSAFANSALTFCRTNNVDGLDLDWEYPVVNPPCATANCPIYPNNPSNFILLLQSVYNTLIPAGYLFTAAMPAGFQHYSQLNLNAASKYLSWINLMTYDYYGTFSPLKLPTSPVISCQGDNYTSPFSRVYNWDINSALQYYYEQGVPKSNIAIGLEFLGRPNAGNTITSPCSLSTDSFNYFELVKMIGKANFPPPDPLLMSSSYIYNGQYIGFDTVESITMKVCYFLSLGFNNFMTFTMNQDDVVNNFELSSAVLSVLSNPSSTCAQYQNVISNAQSHVCGAQTITTTILSTSYTTVTSTISAPPQSYLTIYTWDVTKTKPGTTSTADPSNFPATAYTPTPTATYLSPSGIIYTLGPIYNGLTTIFKVVNGIISIVGSIQECSSISASTFSSVGSVTSISIINGLCQVHFSGMSGLIMAGTPIAGTIIPYTPPTPSLVLPSPTPSKVSPNPTSSPVLPSPVPSVVSSGVTIGQNCVSFGAYNCDSTLSNLIQCAYGANNNLIWTSILICVPPTKCNLASYNCITNPSQVLPSPVPSPVLPSPVPSPVLPSPVPSPVLPSPVPSPVLPSPVPSVVSSGVTIGQNCVSFGAYNCDSTLSNLIQCAYGVNNNLVWTSILKCVPPTKCKAAVYNCV